MSLIKIAAGLGQCHINLFLYHHKCILEFGVQLTTMILEILIDCIYWPDKGSVCIDLIQKIVCVYLPDIGDCLCVLTWYRCLSVCIDLIRTLSVCIDPIQEIVCVYWPDTGHCLCVLTWYRRLSVCIDLIQEIICVYWLDTGHLIVITDLIRTMLL